MKTSLTNGRSTWVRHAAAVVGAAMLTGCVVADEGGTFVEDNNNVRIESPVVTPLSLNGDRSGHAVPVDVAWTMTDAEDLDVALRIESAQVISTDQGGAVNFYAEVTNDGADPVCFVEATSIQLFDASGVPVGQQSHEFIEGSLAYSESLNSNLPACLAGNGGFGYFSAIIPGTDDEPDIDAIRSATLSMDVSDAREEDAPRGELVPIAAQPGLPGAGRIDITLENQGDEPMQIRFLKVTYFDAEGAFLDWAFVYDGTVGPIGAGAQRVVSAPTFGLPRAPAELMVSVDGQPSR